MDDVKIIAGEFYEHKFAEAYDSATKLGISDDELVSFSFTMTQSSEHRQKSAYANNDAASPLKVIVNTQDKVRAAREQFENASNFNAPQSFVQQMVTQVISMGIDGQQHGEHKNIDNALIGQSVRYLAKS